MADILAAVNWTGVVILIVVQASAALAVFVHAYRTGNRYAALWGLGTVVLIAVAVIYVARVWWNAGGREYYRPR